MLKKMLNNKKIVITSITIVILVLVILLVKYGQDKPIGTESESDTGVKQEETYLGDGLEVNEDDEKTENSVDSSGYWEDTEDSGNNTDQTNTKQEDTATSQPAGNKTEGAVENDTENNVGSKTEEPEYENDVSDEDTLEDGTSWGTIY